MAFGFTFKGKGKFRKGKKGRKKALKSGSKPTVKAVRKMISRALDKRIEDKKLIVVKATVGTVAAITATSASTASQVDTGYYQQDLFAGSEFNTDPDQGDRIADEIMLKSIDFRMKLYSQSANSMLVNNCYRVMILKVKTPLPDSTFDISQVFDPDYIYDITDNSNNTLFVPSAYSPNSVRNINYLSSYEVVASKMVYQPAQTSDEQTDWQRYVNLFYRPKKPLKLTFDQSTGAFTNIGFRIVIFSAEGNDGASAPTGAAVPDGVTNVTGNSGAEFMWSVVVRYEDA